MGRFKLQHHLTIADNMVSPNPNEAEVSSREHVSRSQYLQSILEKYNSIFIGVLPGILLFPQNVRQDN